MKSEIPPGFDFGRVEGLLVPPYCVTGPSLKRGRQVRPFKVDSKGNEKKKNAPLSESEAFSLPESVLSSF